MCQMIALLTLLQGSVNDGLKCPLSRKAYGFLPLGNRKRHTPEVSVALDLCASPSQQCKFMSVHLNHPLQNCGAGALNLEK